MLKISKITSDFRQLRSIVENPEIIPGFLTLTVDFRKFRYIFAKFCTGKVAIIFGRFSTVRKSDNVETRESRKVEIFRLTHDLSTDKEARALASLSVQK